MDQISPQALASFLVEFLIKSSCNDGSLLPRDELEELYTFTRSFTPENTEIAEAMSEYVHALWFFLPLDIRKAVAVYDAFQMAMDDVPQEANDTLDHLCSQLAASEGVSHPAWEQFFKFLPQLFQHYGPYIQTTLFRGALEFMQATCLERTLFNGYPGSRYPDYLRRMSAQGPVQAAICFPESEFPQEEYLPIIATVEAEMEHFVGQVNDLFSFYKESSSLKISIVLQECLDTAVACQERTLAILEGVGNKAVSHHVQQFIVGYTRYHLACPRYKIADLCLQSGNKDLAYFYGMSCKALGVPIHPDLVDKTSLGSPAILLRSKSPAPEPGRKAVVASHDSVSRVQSSTDERVRKQDLGNSSGNSDARSMSIDVEVLASSYGIDVLGKASIEVIGDVEIGG